MTRILILLTASSCILIAGFSAQAQQTFRPDDPIASINGSPIYLGELNLVLVDKLRIRNLDNARPDVQKATVALLVRQHLALASLKELGGDALQRIIDREIQGFTSQLKRQGSSLDKYAARRKADAKSVEQSLAFQIAWRQYLKRHLTDQNLRRYFDAHKAKYSGGKWQVSQIFLKLDPKDEAAMASAEERMSELIQELRAASNIQVAFENAAREYSDAPSAGTGGQVGWVSSNGDLPSSVMSTVRSTNVGSISNPVKSPLGLHCVYVQDAKTSDLKFEELSDQAQLRRDATDTLFHRLVQQQKDAKISWYISGLRPPANIPIIPE